MIQVSSQKVWVDDELVIERLSGKNVADHGGRRLVALFDRLAEKRKTVELVNKKAPQAKAFQGVANLVIDKDVNYNLIKKILYTSAEAQFRRYKFVVRGEE